LRSTKKKSLHCAKTKIITLPRCQPRNQLRMGRP
jgi:hypothetical protein